MFYLLAAGARACVYDDDAASCARAMAFWGSRNRAPRAKCAVGGGGTETISAMLNET